MFKELSLKDITGGTAALIQRIPPVCGVYAWFRSVAVNYQDESDVFYKSLIKRASHVHGVTRAKHLGPQVKIEYVPQTNAEERTLPRLDAACKNENFRRWMCNTLKETSQFLPPLYVGAATNLRARVTAHLRASSPLRTRLDNAEIPLSEVVLRYIELPEIDGLDEGLDKEVECIIAYILTPGFSVEYG